MAAWIESIQVVYINPLYVYMGHQEVISLAPLLEQDNILHFSSTNTILRNYLRTSRPYCVENYGVCLEKRIL